ncbi:MAG: hypothetical protein ABIL58_16705 [Pseudomonadota bacterium]
MTYNFDPERWYEIEHSALKHRRDTGRLTEDGFAAAVADLQRRYESMMDGLNSVADFPGSAPPGAPTDNRKTSR